MSGAVSAVRAEKMKYIARFQSYLTEYSRCIVVTVDNVGSHQMQKVRIALRGKAVVIMGKNTLMRKCVRDFLPTNPKVDALLQLIEGNCGLVFTNGDLAAVRDAIKSERVGAPAKAGAIAPCDVTVPAGPTELEPGQTGFLQVLGIASKITKGKIEILNPVRVLKEGDKVGPSEAALLQKLNISPFSYGLEVVTIYDDGSVYSPKVLDISSNDIRNAFLASVGNVAAVSLQIGVPTLASVPHSIANAYKNVLAVAVGTEYSFPKADKVKAYLANPGAFAAAASSSAPAGGKAGGSAAPAAAAAKPKEASAESDGDMGFSLFD